MDDLAAGTVGLGAVGGVVVLVTGVLGVVLDKGGPDAGGLSTVVDEVKVEPDTAGFGAVVKAGVDVDGIDAVVGAVAVGGVGSVGVEEAVGKEGAADTGAAEVPTTAVGLGARRGGAPAVVVGLLAVLTI